MNTIKDLRTKSIQELKNELNEIHREFFNLNLHKSISRSTQTHHLKNAKRKWAQIKTLLTEKIGSAI